MRCSRIWYSQQSHEEDPDAYLDTPSRSDHTLFQGDYDLRADNTVLDVNGISQDISLMFSRI